jgi:SAM-dependent methyltransferase
LTEIEIHEVSLPAKPSDQLWGCSIQVPLIGSGDVGFWIHIGGYVSGRWRPAAAVEFVEGDKVVRVAAVRISRPDVAISRPGERDVEVCGFYALVDARKLSPEFDLRLEAVLENGVRVPMGSVRGRHEYHLAESEKPSQDSSPLAGHVPASGIARERAIPSIRDDLQGLIREALTEVSADTTDDGNHLRADIETSLAEVDTSLLDGLVLAGKTVLELGAGTGERARAARARGAVLVDGFEPDPGLLALARLLSAYHHTSRVFFHQEDDVLQAAGGQEYDVVLALSGFDLVRDRLDAIASITLGVFVTELPATDPDRAAALESAQASFPFNELLELSTGPGTAEQRGSRFFLVGATGEPGLRSGLLGLDGVTATR